MVSELLLQAHDLAGLPVRRRFDRPDAPRCVTQAPFESGGTYCRPARAGAADRTACPCRSPRDTAHMEAGWLGAVLAGAVSSNLLRAVRGRLARHAAAL